MSEYNDNKVDRELWQDGADVGIYHLPKTILNMLCKQFTEEGIKTDWAYSCGRAGVVTEHQERVRKVKKVFDFYQWMFTQFEDHELSSGDYNMG
jgi:hypothetical protein